MTRARASRLICRAALQFPVFPFAAALFHYIRYTYGTRRFWESNNFLMNLFSRALLCARGWPAMMIELFVADCSGACVLFRGKKNNKQFFVFDDTITYCENYTADAVSS